MRPFCGATIEREGFVSIMVRYRDLFTVLGSDRDEATGSKTMFSLSRYARSDSCVFFNLYDKSRPQAENQTKRGEIDFFRTISKVLVYVFCSKRIDFLRNTLETPVASLLSVECLLLVIGKQKKPILLKVTEPSSIMIPYRSHSVYAKMAAYPDPPLAPVILVPESVAAQITSSPGCGLLANQDRDD